MKTAGEAPEPSMLARRRWGAKYAFERTLALALLLLATPVIVLLAAAIKLTSRGPILYSSERLGRGGRTFRLHKFRSMRTDAPMVLAPDGKVIVTADDARFTPIGRFLRLGFDELPQLFNVVCGEMCLIGPRPDVPWELERYSGREHLRLLVLPGISGLAAVLDGRALGNAENYELDVQYVTHSTARLDLRIAAATVPYALGSKNVARRLLGSWGAGNGERHPRAGAAH